MANDKLDIQLLEAQDRCIRNAGDSPDMAYKHKWYMAYSRLCNYRLERNIRRRNYVTNPSTYSRLIAPLD